MDAQVRDERGLEVRQRRALLKAACPEDRNRCVRTAVPPVERLARTEPECSHVACVQLEARRQTQETLERVRTHHRSLVRAAIHEQVHRPRRRSARRTALAVAPHQLGECAHRCVPHAHLLILQRRLQSAGHRFFEGGGIRCLRQCLGGVGRLRLHNEVELHLLLFVLVATTCVTALRAVVTGGSRHTSTLVEAAIYLRRRHAR